MASTALWVTGILIIGTSKGRSSRRDAPGTNASIRYYLALILQAKSEGEDFTRCLSASDFRFYAVAPFGVALLGCENHAV